MSPLITASKLATLPAFRRSLCRHIEIGSSHGDTLVRLALLRPYDIAIGFEKDDAKCTDAAKHINAHGIANAMVVRGNAYDVMKAIPDAAITTIRVYFPTPPHYVLDLETLTQSTTSLIGIPMLMEMKRVTHPGASVFIATDQTRVYKEFSSRTATADWWQRSWDSEEHRFFDSGCARKYRREGKRIHTLRLLRTTTTSHADR